MTLNTEVTRQFWWWLTPFSVDCIHTILPGRNWRHTDYPQSVGLTILSLMNALLGFITFNRWDLIVPCKKRRASRDVKGVIKTRKNIMRDGRAQGPLPLSSPLFAVVCRFSKKRKAKSERSKLKYWFWILLNSVTLWVLGFGWSKDHQTADNLSL